MQREVTKSWALFLGIGTIMIAHGLQMQVRSAQDGQAQITDDMDDEFKDYLSLMRAILSTDITVRQEDLPVQI